jgi:putative tricarboxylic transport membrane protein
VKSPDRFTSLFCLLVAVYACIGAIRMGLGSLRAPGMGLMPFGASVLLAFLSLIVFFRGFLDKGAPKSQPISSHALGKGVLLILVVLIVYAKLMPVAGYLIATFFLMAFLFLVAERNKAWQMLLLSFVTTVITYFVFSKWFNLQFPRGFFGL